LKIFIFNEGSGKKVYTSPNMLRDDIMNGTLNNDERDVKCMESCVGKLKGNEPS
jgi:hypothetical protein